MARTSGTQRDAHDPYRRYLRGWNAKCFGAQDYDMHGDYAYALGAFHAQERIAPESRSAVLPIIAAHESETITVSKKRKVA